MLTQAEDRVCAGKGAVLSVIASQIRLSTRLSSQRIADLLEF